MEWLYSHINWRELLFPDTPLVEIFIRGSVIYLSLFLMLRFILKRQAGSIGISDLLVIVLIADAAQNGMADDYKSLPDGIFLVTTLIFWNVFLEWLGFHFPAVEKFLATPPLLLIKNGRMLRQNMRKELITEDELMSQIRLQGLEDISEIKRACLEGDGKISLILHHGKLPRTQHENH